MKKIILSVVMLSATFFVSQAQVQYGLKAGANFYTFGGDEVENEDLNSKFGLHIGGLVNFSVSEKFKVQPEIVFSIQGSKQTDGTDELNWNFNYLNIPIMAQFYVSNGFFLETGPQIGFNLKAEIKDEESGTTFDLDDEIKSTDISWGLGAGYKTASGFGFGARYNLGLSSIAEESDVDIKNRGFQVGVFYLFGGKKAKKD
ncbi:MAG: PorT family protein [Chitinophagaceae bacterium]|nr:PorT family protein [Chitinophagaceae bacterium]MBK9380654.1 PorT family protein [Chitinophagaceae bacterium]MBP6215392.1 PorT family protein [Chitinophagaceae bacterium]HQV60061.1 porin family protein [Chitinophagaceae bacterium]HQV86039.1 porin family protein [Chitinophagaceae bacterium]